VWKADVCFYPGCIAQVSTTLLVVSDSSLSSSNGEFLISSLPMLFLFLGISICTRRWGDLHRNFLIHGTGRMRQRKISPQRHLWDGGYVPALQGPHPRKDYRDTILHINSSLYIDTPSSFLTLSSHHVLISVTQLGAFSFLL